MGIEPTSSAWKAEVIAIIRRSRECNLYIRNRVDLSTTRLPAMLRVQVILAFPPNR